MLTTHALMVRRVLTFLITSRAAVWQGSQEMYVRLVMKYPTTFIFHPRYSLHYLKKASLAAIQCFLGNNQLNDGSTRQKRTCN